MSEQVQMALANINVSAPSVFNRRQELVDSIKGKYRHVPTSSELFLHRKRADTALECRP